MSDEEAPKGGPSVEDDVALPKSTVVKFIQEFLPDGMTCVKDAKDIVTDLCKEFIVLVTSEANDLCEKASKKTIMPEHIVAALKSLGFDDYVAEVETITEDHKTQTKERSKKSQARNQKVDDATAEEMAAAQEKLFQASRMRLETGVSQETVNQESGPAPKEE